MGLFDPPFTLDVAVVGVQVRANGLASAHAGPRYSDFGDGMTYPAHRARVSPRTAPVCPFQGRPDGKHAGFRSSVRFGGTSFAVRSSASKGMICLAF